MESNSNLCRVCLDPEDANVHLPIFDDVNQVAERIFLISGVQVAELNDTSAVICRQCLDDLSQAFCFREKCLKAEKHFRSFDSQNLSSFPKTELISKVEILEYELLDNCKDHLEEDLENREEVVFEIQVFNNTAVRRSSRRNLNVKEVKKDTKRKERFFCSKCFKSFCDQSYLKKHEYYRHSEIPVEDLYECDFCGHKTKTKQLVRNHITTIHSLTPREKFVCRVCGKMLSTKGNLDGHEKTHVEMDLSEYVTCPVCNKHFREKRFMIEHRKLVHDKSKAFQCPHCPHVSTCKGAYNKHFKSVHLKLRDFICTECGLGFSTNSQLTRHFRIHTGERPYECKNCTKPFRLSSHRKRHEEICPKKLNQ